MKKKFLVISFDYLKDEPSYDFVLAVNEEHAEGMIQHLRGETTTIVDVFSVENWLTLSKKFIGMGPEHVLRDLRERVTQLKAVCEVCNGVIRCSENGVLMCNCLEEDEWKAVEEQDEAEALAADGDTTPYAMTDTELQEYYWKEPKA